MNRILYKKATDMRKALNELKLRLKCSRCDEDHPACLDFHHRDPEQKRFDISNFSARSVGFSWQDIEDEIAKCVVLCSNCHRKLHYNIKHLMKANKA